MPARISTGATSIALRSVLQAQLRGECSLDALRRAIALVCIEAHRHTLPPEQLIVSIKDAWWSLPEAQGTARVGQKASLLDDVVRMCIEEYYARAA
jgi:hypothetical protein